LDAVAILDILGILVELLSAPVNAAIMDFALLQKLAAALEAKWEATVQWTVAVEDMVHVILTQHAFAFNTTSKKCEPSCFGQLSANCYGPNLLACNGCAQGSCNNGTCVCWPGYSDANCST